jgi:hypothetical protein
METIDFSRAETVMGSFKTFAIYGGSSSSSGALSGRESERLASVLQTPYPKRSGPPVSSAGAPVGSDRSPGRRFGRVTDADNQTR